jgi:D-serine deaminase-like pyridoxal phosphate-dependent protein
METKPTLLIDKKKVVENITKMKQKTELSCSVFRPHFKTHQSAEIGELFREKGIERIAVSSVSMAEYFAKNGWSDITIAFPVNLREIKNINALAAKINLNLLVDSVYSAKILSDELINNCDLFIEIDNGYHRSGLLPTNHQVIDQVVELTSNTPKLNFKGFLTHAGNTYSAKSREEIIGIMEDAASQLNGLKEKYKSQFPDLITSYGDTPSCSLSNDFSAFDEIRPGNFVYYDVMQYHIGSCQLNEIAVAVTCPVVSVYPEKNELVIYGGAVHLSKEMIEADNGFKLYGYVVKLSENGWSKPIPGAYVSLLSQEHGIIKFTDLVKHNFKPGDLIGILPIHSCLTANLLKKTQCLI